MTSWNPDLYLKYRNERTQPSIDLVSRIDLDAPAGVVDLGCGPGNSTQALRERWPSARLIGLDSSPEMIAKAKATFPEGEWVHGDVGSWKPAQPFDLVFSNATLQWVPDHEALIPRLFSSVKPGGALAVQVPANDNSPLHQALLHVSEQPDWKARTAGCRAIITYHSPAFYYDLLCERAARIEVWQTAYFHIMGGAQDLLDWYSGTGMKPYLDRLGTPEERKRFSAEVIEACIDLYPVRTDGRILFPFRRTFFIAYQA